MTGKDQPGWQRPTAVEIAVFFNELLLLAVLGWLSALRGQSSARPPVIASIREFSAGPMAQQVRVPGAS